MPARSTTATETLTVRWTGAITHTRGTTRDTVVECITPDGRKVHLLLDDDFREALGGSLSDPFPEDYVEETDEDQGDDIGPCCAERGTLAYLCTHCGEPIPTSEALAHPCTNCDAPAGQPCDTACQTGN